MMAETRASILGVPKIYRANPGWTVNGKNRGYLVQSPPEFRTAFLSHLEKSPERLSKGLVVGNACLSINHPYDAHVPTPQAPQIHLGSRPPFSPAANPWPGVPTPQPRSPNRTRPRRQARPVGVSTCIRTPSLHCAPRHDVQHRRLSRCSTSHHSIAGCRVRPWEHNTTRRSPSRQTSRSPTFRERQGGLGGVPPGGFRERTSAWATEESWWRYGFTGQRDLLSSQPLRLLDLDHW